jgi:hypothetical protein
MTPHEEGHLDLIMCEIRQLRLEVGQLRHEMREDLGPVKADIGSLKSFRDKQLGMVALVGFVATVLGGVIVKGVALIGGKQ